jgi:multiple sugar transport system permease protein/raffinose/stachyose/melibiose transport system permease protein
MGISVAGAEPEPAARRRSLLRRGFGQSSWWAILEFVGPATLLYLLFVVIPLFMTFFNSVHILQIRGGAANYEFVGLQHYRDLFTNDLFFGLAIRNSVIWAVTSPFLEIPIAFVLAYLVHQNLPLRRFYRVTWFLPMLVSWVVVGALFRWIFNAEWGIVNIVLRPFGLDHKWLGDPNTALPSLIAVTTWKFIGFNFVILLAGLASIPEETLDAAVVDGANHIQKIFKIILPMLKRTWISLMLLCFVGKMRVFELVWVMTRGAPSGHTETVATYIQKRAFEWMTFDLGYPSAIAVVWFIVVFVSWLLLSRIFLRGEALEF